MRAGNIFIMIVLVGLVVSLFLNMLNEERIYLHNDYDPNEFSSLNKTQEVNEIGNKLSAKFEETLGTKSEVSLTNVVSFSFTGLKELGKILVTGVGIVPSLLKDLLKIVLPQEVAGIVSGAITGAVTILLLFAIIKFIVRGED